MTTPGAYDDARQGLSQDLLDDLRQADAVVIGLKDLRTAVIKIDVSSRVRFAVLPAEVQLLHGHALLAEQPLVIADAQHDVLWRNVVDALHVDEVATVDWKLGWAAVAVAIALGPSAHLPRLNAADLQRLTVPMQRLDAWPIVSLTSRSTQCLPLGFTTQRRRWRVGHPTWVWQAPASF